jgi:hypothetical protein
MIECIQELNLAWSDQEWGTLEIKGERRGGGSYQRAGRFQGRWRGDGMVALTAELTPMHLQALGRLQTGAAASRWLPNSRVQEWKGEAASPWSPPRVRVAALPPSHPRGAPPPSAPSRTTERGVGTKRFGSSQNDWGKIPRVERRCFPPRWNRGFRTGIGRGLIPAGSNRTHLNEWAGTIPVPADPRGLERDPGGVRINWTRSNFSQKISSQETWASFGFKVILKYSVNTLVSKKNEVSNTLRRLDLVNTLALKTEVSSKTSFFCLIGDFSPDLFFF